MTWTCSTAVRAATRGYAASLKYKLKGSTRKPVLHVLAVPRIETKDYLFREVIVGRKKARSDHGFIGPIPGHKPMDFDFG